MTDSQTYYHGTKADLKVGDLIEPGYASNYFERKPGNFIYLSATLDAAIWGAELAVGAGRGRIYIVEPTGSIEDDPNLTNKRFPGKSYEVIPFPESISHHRRGHGLEGSLPRSAQGNARSP